jgi:hypothetical protein
MPPPRFPTLPCGLALFSGWPIPSCSFSLVHYGLPGGLTGSILRRGGFGVLLLCFIMPLAPPSVILFHLWAGLKDMPINFAS